MPADKITWVEKDRKARRSFGRSYLKKLILKSLLYNETFDSFSKMHWALSFHNNPLRSSPATFRRACNLTYNPRSIFRLFKLNRHSLKRVLAQGGIQGVRKASF